VTVLAGRGITRRYGGLAAVDDVDIEVASGEVVALIGPNGAGKTTLFSCLTGTERPDAGQVLLDGVELTGLSADQVARRGVGRTFQRLALFSSLPVRDNLRIGAESRRGRYLARGLLGLGDADGAKQEQRVAEVADLLGLTDVLDQVAGALPTGTQRLVELGRALCRDPQVLLLDEPASGLDTGETRHLQAVLRDLAAQGMAVLLVEHDLDLVMRTADRVYAMAAGRVLASGTADEVGRDPRVHAVYLSRTAP
jgi:branched-chain amino acid transport system ATP-binding protein